MGDLLGFLKDLSSWLIDKAEWLLCTVINLVISAFAAAFGALVSLLPASAPAGLTPPDLPVTEFAGNSFLGVLNWFLPVTHVVSSLAFYLAAVVLYFSIAPVLRWVKVVR